MTAETVERRAPEAGPVDVRLGAEAAARHLLDGGQATGGWSDYLLPVGASTAWVTAHVAGALVAAAARGVRPPCLAGALAAADEVLSEPGPQADGWGFNAATDPDADSTAWTVLFLAARRAIPARVGAFLLAHRQLDGGYSTYRSPDAWGRSHPCVTPVVTLALRALGQPVGASTLGYVRRSRWDDGTWPSYWWRGSHYSTYWNLVLLRSLGVPLARRLPVVGGRETAQVRSTLDLACLLGVLHLRAGLGPSAGRLAALLLSRQRPDGGFDGGLDLRVTHHECREPWDRPVGQLYRDDEGLLTTAIALRVLAGLLPRAPASPAGVRR